MSNVTNKVRDQVSAMRALHMKWLRGELAQSDYQKALDTFAKGQ